jgi:hypothetical protein
MLAACPRESNSANCLSYRNASVLKQGVCGKKNTARTDQPKSKLTVCYLETSKYLALPVLVE